jgi:copper chaperone CopZ/thiol-disulfide isomerase/thioredoxin
MKRHFAVAALLLLLPTTARAEATRIYSLQGADCESCADKVRGELKKVKGVKKVDFDKRKVEITVRLDETVSDTDVVAAVERAGLRAVVGSGHGAYLPAEKYPAESDVRVLTADGSAVGRLDKLRVPDKYTVFDVYAEWCGPCRFVDARLREVVATRKDVAVRKLNVVDFDTPLAKELGSRVEALPYVIVFDPAGKRTDIVGADFGKLDKALGVTR